MLFEFDRDEILVLDAAAAHRATEEVAGIHGIPASRSPDLITSSSGTDAPTVVGMNA